MYISQLVKGLRLVDVQGIRIHTVRDLTAAEKTIAAASRKKSGDRRVVFRFQEPAYVVRLRLRCHFRNCRGRPTSPNPSQSRHRPLAYASPVPLPPLQVDRYSSAVELQVLLPNRRRRQKQQEQANAGLSKLVAKEQRVLLQVEMPNGAYTTRQQFVEMLHERVAAAASKLALPGRFEVKLEDGDIVLAATKCPFRILFKVCPPAPHSTLKESNTQDFLQPPRVAVSIVPHPPLSLRATWTEWGVVAAQCTHAPGLRE